MYFRSISRRFMLLLGVVVWAVTLVACASNEGDGGSGVPEGGVMVEVGLTEFVMDASQTELPVGAPVTFSITNNGVIEHELVIEPAGAEDQPLTNPDGSVAEVEGIGPGDTVSFTYTFEEAGSYQIACHVPGHYEAGMVVTITVE